MESDFYLLKDTQINLDSELDFQVLKDSNTAVSTKVILTSLTPENLTFMSQLTDESLKNCVFIYLKPPKESTTVDLNHWTSVFNKFSPTAIIKTEELNNSHLTGAIHTLRENEHNTSLKKLVADDKNFLHQQKQDQLEKLLESEKKLLRNQKRVKHAHLNESLNLNCLESIFNSKSVGEIEDRITSILREPFRIDWVRILVSPSDILTELPTIKFQNQFETKVFDLDYDTKIQGKVVFASQKGKYIKESTVPLLQKISDALSLRLKQIATESEIEHSNLQWESTFKAIPFKAALITKDFRILEYGGKFNTQKIKDNKSPLCYEKFFDRTKPCEGCKLGENFLVDQKNDSLEVNSKEIFDPINDEHYYLNFYRDFEVSTLGESGKATKTKLEELGIISGSIAHELNNPLGGIKILLELLAEDENLSSKEEKQDLDVLMKSTNKCIDIVSELLNFTRAKRSDSQPESRTLAEYFEQLKIFTQAYLLSEGVILKVVEGPYLEQKILSPDSTLSIKLLEAIAHLSKNINKSNLGETTTVFLYGSPPKENMLKIMLSSEEPSGVLLKQLSIKPLEKPIPITPSEGSFEEFTSSNQEQTLTLKFSTEVKLNGTHV